MCRNCTNYFRPGEPEFRSGPKANFCDHCCRAFDKGFQFHKQSKSPGPKNLPAVPGCRTCTVLERRCWACRQKKIL